MSDMKIKWKQNDPYWKIIFKILGVVAIFMSAFIYGEFKFVEGYQTLCLEENGFLVTKDKSLLYCMPEHEYAKDGWVLNKDHKILVNRPNAFYRLNYSEVKWNYGNGSNVP